MKFFRAVEFVATFSAWPLLIRWLYYHDDELVRFLSIPAFVVYIVGFFALVCCVEDTERRIHR